MTSASRWKHFATTRDMLLVVVAITARLYCVESQSVSESERLLRDKTSNYSTVFRPVINQSLPLKLFTSFDIVAIHEFDERSEKFSVTGILNLKWRDERFTWNPDHYDGISQLVVDVNRIWTPPIALVNSAEDVTRIAEDWHLLTINHTGDADYSSGRVFSVSCSVDVTRYPWDRQTCQFWFLNWGYELKHLPVYFERDAVGSHVYSENGAWSIVGSDVGLLPGTSVFFFELHLKRKSRYIIVNVLSPIVFMSFLNVLIFLIPADSGERISYSITVLLAIAVFLTLVGDNLPKTSEPMSNLSFYLLSVLVVSASITLANIFCLQLFFRDAERKVGKIWKYVAVCLGCNRKGRKRENYKERKTSEQYIEQSGIIPANINGNIYLPTNIPSITRQNIWTLRRCELHGPYTTEKERTADGKEEDTQRQNDDSDNVTWRDVSHSFDKLFFWLFVVVVFSLTLIFMFTTSCSH